MYSEISICAVYLLWVDLKAWLWKDTVRAIRENVPMDLLDFLTIIILVQVPYPQSDLDILGSPYISNTPQP